MLARDFTSKRETVKESLRDINDPAMLKSTIEKNGSAFLKDTAEFIVRSINTDDYFKRAANASFSIRNPFLAIVKYTIDGVVHEIQLKFNKKTLDISCKIDGKSLSSPLSDLNDDFFTYEDYEDYDSLYDEMAYDYLFEAIDNPNQNDRPQSNRRFNASDFDGFF